MSVNDEDIVTTVRYSAKELFAKIDAKLDVIANTLTAKADHEMVVRLEARVAKLESASSEQKGFDKAKVAIGGLMLTVVGLVIPLALHYIN